MFDRSKPKIGCSSSITNRWTCSSSFDVRKMMFEFVRCLIKWCSTHHYYLVPLFFPFLCIAYFVCKHVFYVVLQIGILLLKWLMLFFHENFEIVVVLEEEAVKRGLVDVKTAARMSFSENLWLYLWLGSTWLCIAYRSEFELSEQIKCPDHLYPKKPQII